MSKGSSSITPRLRGTFGSKIKTWIILATLPAVFLTVVTLSVVAFSSTLILSNSHDKRIVQEERTYSIFSAAPPEQIVLGESVVPKEARGIILEKYLNYYKSPLAPYSSILIKVSDKYGLDWRLLPAIAGQESSFAKNIPVESHNAWGWGIHSRGTRTFSSWEEAIEKVGRSLREDFLDKGLTTPKELMIKYAPVSMLYAGGAWAENVEYFMGEMETF